MLPKVVHLKTVLLITFVCLYTGCTRSRGLSSKIENGDCPPESSCSIPYGGPGVNAKDPNAQKFNFSPIGNWSFYQPSIPAIIVTAADDVSAYASSVSTTITISAPVVINIAGYVRGHFQSSPAANGGITATISIDNERCASNLSFEGVASSIHFQSTVNCIKLLAKGTYTIKVHDLTAGSYSVVDDYFSRLQYYTLPQSPDTHYAEVATNTSLVRTTYVNTEPQMLSISGFVKATHRSLTPVNAGVKATISVDGNDCAFQFAFEGKSELVTFSSNANCNVLLPAGTHVIQVYDSKAGEYSTMSGYSSQLQAIAIPAISVAQAGQKISSTSSLQTTIDVDRHSLIDISGYVRGSYTGATRNAGVSGSITIDGNLCTSNLAFETYSSNIAFSTSPKCITTLAPGSHAIRVYDAVAGNYPNMSNYRTQLQFLLHPLN